MLKYAQFYGFEALKVLFKLVKFCFWSGLFAVGVAGAATSALYYQTLGDLPDVNELKDVTLETPMKIYTADNKLIGEFGESKRIPVDFDKIPDNLRKDILRYMIKFIRYGVNPEKYLSYKIGQLFEITKGIKEGLDISQFDDISLDKDQMKKIRQKLYNEKMSKYQAI